MHRELTDKEIAEIAGIYHVWRTEGGAYKDMPGWWKSATLEEIKSHEYVLTPGRYVGAEAIENDAEPFEIKMKRLTAKLGEQFETSAKMEKVIRENLKGLGYEF